jgi:hypothetical protein
LESAIVTTYSLLLRCPEAQQVFLQKRLSVESNNLYLLLNGLYDYNNSINRITLQILSLLVIDAPDISIPLMIVTEIIRYICKNYLKHDNDVLKESLIFLSQLFSSQQAVKEYCATETEFIQNIRQLLQELDNTEIIKHLFHCLSSFVYNTDYDIHDLKLDQAITSALKLLPTLSTDDNNRSSLVTIMTFLLNSSSSSSIKQLLQQDIRLLLQNLIQANENDDDEVAHLIVLLLKSIVYDNHDSSQQFIELGGIDVLLTIIRNHSSSSDDESDDDEEYNNDQQESDISHTAFTTITSLHGSLALKYLVNYIDTVVKNDETLLNIYLPVLNGLVYMNTDYDNELLWNIYQFIRNNIVENRNTQLWLQYGLFIMCNLTSLSNTLSPDNLKIFQNRIGSDSRFIHELIQLLSLDNQQQEDSEDINSMIHTVLHNICFNNDANLQRLLVSSTMIDDRKYMLDVLVHDLMTNDGGENEELYESGVKLLLLLNEEPKYHAICNQLNANVVKVIEQVEMNDSIDDHTVAKCQQILGKNKLI